MRVSMCNPNHILLDRMTEKMVKTWKKSLKLDLSVNICSLHTSVLILNYWGYRPEASGHVTQSSSTFDSWGSFMQVSQVIKYLQFEFAIRTKWDTMIDGRALLMIRWAAVLAETQCCSFASWCYCAVCFSKWHHQWNMAESISQVSFTSLKVRK